MVQGADGQFYGAAHGGGTNGYGTIFKLSAGGAFDPLYSFRGGADGAGPSATLALGNDGNFYGVCDNGSISSEYGTIFKITPSGVLTPLYSFNGTNDGGYPEAPLTLGTDGKFYGTTEAAAPMAMGPCSRSPRTECSPRCIPSPTWRADPSRMRLWFRRPTAIFISPAKAQAGIQSRDDLAFDGSAGLSIHDQNGKRMEFLVERRDGPEISIAVEREFESCRLDQFGCPSYRPRAYDQRHRREPGGKSALLPCCGAALAFFCGGRRWGLDRS